MAFIRKINQMAKTESNSGFGANGQDNGGRFVNKNGNANVKISGINFLTRTSWYHTMLAMPRWKFILFIFLFYIIINLIFASLYCVIGVQHLAGIIDGSSIEKFGEAFFFSTQTFTTVGFGRISPTGFLTSTLSAFEALIGLLSFALLTGLFYGRFSKPKAFIKFSENALIAPFKDFKGLMIRIAPFKNISLVDVSAKLTLGMRVEENGKMLNKFFQLPLEYEMVNSLTVGWTIVHPINEESPIYQFTKEEFKNIKGELIVFIKAFDDMFSNTVVTRTSYTFAEVIYGAKFEKMYHPTDDKQGTILEINRINKYNLVDFFST